MSDAIRRARIAGPSFIPILAFLQPARARGAASFDPTDGTPPAPVESGPVPIELLAASLALVGVVVAFAIAWRSRPAWRSRLGALAGAAPIVAAGLAIVAIGIWFSDWSGAHRVSWPAVGVGALVAAAGLIVVVRGWRRSPRSPGRRDD